MHIPKGWATMKRKERILAGLENTDGFNLRDLGTGKEYAALYQAALELEADKKIKLYKILFLAEDQPPEDADHWDCFEPMTFVHRIGKKYTVEYVSFFVEDEVARTA